MDGRLVRQAQTMKRKIPMSLVIELLGGETGRTRYSGWTDVHCPFHGEGDSHASATISRDETKFHCFACDFGGDIFDVVMKAKVAKDFKEAVAWLEDNVASRMARNTTTN